jgi:hypothetical protein
MIFCIGGECGLSRGGLGPGGKRLRRRDQPT